MTDVDSRSGALFCQFCEDFVWDPTLEELRVRKIGTGSFSGASPSSVSLLQKREKKKKKKKKKKKNIQLLPAATVTPWLLTRTRLIHVSRPQEETRGDVLGRC